MPPEPFAKHERSPSRGEPAYYTLQEVHCPGTKLTTKGKRKQCGALWDRREIKPDRAVHEVLCKSCGWLILYRLEMDAVDDRAVVVVISIQRPREWTDE